MRKFLIGLLILSAACSKPPVADPPWKALSARDDAFSIEGPGEPESKDINEYHPPHNIKGVQYNWQPPSNRFYLAMYMSFPPAMSSAMDMGKALKSIAEGIARRSNGSIVDEKPAMVAGLPAVEFEVKMGAHPGSLRIRAFERGGTVYLLAAGWPEGKESVADEDRFFESFKLRM